jgi:hypothetical protein
MRVEQRVWGDGRFGGDGAAALGEAGLVLVFGGTEALERGDWVAALRRDYPAAQLFGCSTAGEIAGTKVLDDSVVASAIAFDRARFELHVQEIDGAGGENAGAALAAKIPTEALRHVFVLSDGLAINGSDLCRGLAEAMPPGLHVTGGLAGDGARFEKTYVLAGETLRRGAVAAIGLYGEGLRVGFGSRGGWDPFGPMRIVTRSEGNVLYELDGKPALELYKTYLGEHAGDLPASGLLFPLNVRRKDQDDTLVRTILAVDEDAQSMTFAGDVPVDATAQLMKANFDRLIEGAEGAAQQSWPISDGKAELALLISCVGRKLVLKQRTEEEVEGVHQVVGTRAALTGFYSYGEICPSAPEASCELHNQTMTITTFSEQ